MKSRGFTLVELMIAVALGLFVLAGTLTAWMHAQRSYARAQVENRLHERVQYVYATLEPELQMAGFLGIGATVPAPDAVGLALSARSCGDALITELARPLEASNNRYDLACPAQGRGAVAGTDVLTIRRASAQLSSPDPGRAQLLGTLWPPATRTLIWDGALPPGTTLQPSRTELRDLIVRSYYVARSSDGDRNTPALRVKTLTAISGRPAFVDTEVMAGIEDLQVAVSPPAGIPRSIQVTLGVRADAADTRAGDALSRRRVSRHFALRNIP